jgi:predicted ferric reductase
MLTFTCFEKGFTVRVFGILLIIVALAIPIVDFASFANKHDASALFSQYLGVAALITMAISQIIATRLPGVELIFGSIDRSYILHRWLGVGAMIAILLHDTVDAEMDGLGRETFIVELAETLGELSLYGLLILVMTSIMTFVPYHLWKWTHRAMGGFYVAATFHFVFILKPFDVLDPVGVYVSAFCGLGILAYLYTLLPAKMRLSRKYEVTGIRHAGDIIQINLSPKRKPLRFEPGQFAILTPESSDLKEPHPYTISGQGTSVDDIGFSIKTLGDFTHRLSRDLKMGTPVWIQGPFGRFIRRPSKETEIWIAGGIGITPFAAWAQNLKDSAIEVHLFYCVKNQNDAIYSKTLQQTADSQENFCFHLIDSSRQERLSAKSIERISKLDLPNSKVYFCGPKNMRKDLIQG